MTTRPCRTCGTLTSRRDHCVADPQRQRNTRNAKLHARELIAHHVQQHGWTCPGWQRPPHPVAAGTLTADHTTALADGGNPAPDAVLCRPCNGAKGDR